MYSQVRGIVICNMGSTLTITTTQRLDLFNDLNLAVFSSLPVGARKRRSLITSRLKEVKSLCQIA